MVHRAPSGMRTPSSFAGTISYREASDLWEAGLAIRLNANERSDYTLIQTYAGRRTPCRIILPLPSTQGEGSGEKLSIPI